MKKLLVVIFFASFGLLGLDASAQDLGDLRPIESVSYQSNSDIAVGEELAKVKGVIERMKADSTMVVYLVGYDDRLKPREQSDFLAENRSAFLVEYMKSYGIGEDRVSSRADDSSAVVEGKSGCRVDFYQIPDSMALTFNVAQSVKILNDAVAVDAPQNTPTVEKQDYSLESAGVVGQDDVIEEKKGGGREDKDPMLQVHTNLLYMAAGVINFGAEYKNRSGSLGVLLNGGYSPMWSEDYKYNLGVWFVSPELRYYLSRNPRWFVGVQMLYGEYNVKIVDKGYQGSVIAGGVTAGHVVRLSDHFDMSFTLGVGYGYLEYDSYLVADGFNVSDERGVKKSVVMPIQLGVNLIWKLDGVFSSKNN